MNDRADDEPELTLRPPTPLRIYVAVFSAVWLGFVLAFLVGAVAAGRSSGAIVSVFMLAFGGWLGLRLFSLSVVATRQELVIRNYLTTRRIAKDHVEGFRIGSPSMGTFGRAVVALVPEDTVVSLDATARPFRWLGGERQLDSALSALRAWRAG